jgi:hypothetical protein
MPVLVVDDASSAQHLDLAEKRLADCSGAVELAGVVTLRPDRQGIECTVTVPPQFAARCEEEYKVLVENAGRALASSRLGRRLPDRPLKWVVVEDSKR